MGTPLKNPPVYFTIAQVRFNTLLKLSEFLPAIQENMRKTGFPDFVTNMIFELRVVMKDNQAIPTPVSNERYIFGTVDKRHCFVLGADSITLQSTDYGNFESFSTMFLEGLAVVHQEVELNFTERVGVRYLDFVAPKGNDKLGQYLVSQAFGLSSCLEGEPIHAYYEAFNAVGKVKLMARVVSQSGGLALPPDLGVEGMNINPRFMNYQGPHVVLDTDGYIESRLPFSVDTVAEQLREIHQVIGTTFKATTTDYARAVWDE